MNEGNELEEPATTDQFDEFDPGDEQPDEVDEETEADEPDTAPDEEEDAPVDVSGIFESLAAQIGRPPTQQEFDAWNEAISDNPAQAMYQMVQRAQAEAMAQQRVAGYQEQVAMATRPQLYQEFAPYMAQVRAHNSTFQPKTERDVRQLEYAAISCAMDSATTDKQRAAILAKAARAYGGQVAAPKAPAQPLAPAQRAVSTSRGAARVQGSAPRRDAERDLLESLGYGSAIEGRGR